MTERNKPALPYILWNQFLKYLHKKLFDVLKWKNDRKQSICFNLFEKQRGNVQDENM